MQKLGIPQLKYKNDCIILIHSKRIEILVINQNFLIFQTRIQVKNFC